MILIIILTPVPFDQQFKSAQTEEGLVIQYVDAGSDRYSSQGSVGCGGVGGLLRSMVGFLQLREMSQHHARY